MSAPAGRRCAHPPLRLLALFTRTIDERFEGPGADRAHTLAVRIAANPERNLDEYVAREA